MSVAERLFDADARPGIAGTAYDTAWLASVSVSGNPAASRFPEALQWLVEHQHGDGSWGGPVRYLHDRVLCTLAALSPLAQYGRRRSDRARVAAGTRFLWQNGHHVASESVELVGFELLLPTLIDRARRAGVPVPPDLDHYGDERAQKLQLLPAEALYSPRATVVHSLEFLGDQANFEALRGLLGGNGAIGNSPAATAFYLMRNEDPRAQAYLEECLRRSGGATAPVLHPCETFELLWSAYHLFLAGVPVERLLGPAERAFLRAALARDGAVSLSPSFPIPDADDTAVALLLLHRLGDPVDATPLQRFMTAEGFFASYPYERHSSVGVNLHALQALLRVPGYPDREATIDRLLDFILDQQIHGLYWLDKWHISPYYATSHALRALADLPPAQAIAARGAMETAREWLRQTQNADGSWGFYGEGTAEETAYAIFGLAAGSPSGQERDARRIVAGLGYLDGALAESRQGGLIPPLWIDKCLYTPTLVVEAVVETALILGARVVAEQLHRGRGTFSRRLTRQHPRRGEVDG